MDERLSSNEVLIARIDQLEHERAELHKDIERLCMQQAQPSYPVMSSFLYSQRTPGLEEEIEILKTKMSALTKENLDLHEMLSEAYRVKGQLAELHAAEVSKNVEAEKQIKFFQGCVAAAFAERDHSLVEAEKAKEKEEHVLHGLNDLHKRVEELNLSLSEGTRINEELQCDIAKQEERNEILHKVVDKFYKIRCHSNGGLDDMNVEEQCVILLRDTEDSWSFSNYQETSILRYIGSLEEERDMLKKSVDNLQFKLSMGLEIENHLKKKVTSLEKKHNRFWNFITSRIALLLQEYSQFRAHTEALLEGENFMLKTIIDNIEQNFLENNVCGVPSFFFVQRDEALSGMECRNTRSSNVAEQIPETAATCSKDTYGAGNPMDVLELVMREKVAALLLLSQEEERHLLERNVSVALQKKIDDLQRSLLQVTNEKVKALMSLAQLKKEYQLLHEKFSDMMEGGDKERIFVHENSGTLRNLLKKAYKKHWPRSHSVRNEAETLAGSQTDYASMCVENAILKEGMECMWHLASSIRRLRTSLLVIKESLRIEGSAPLKSMEEFIREAKQLRTALGSSLYVTRQSGIGQESMTTENTSADYMRVDAVSDVGFEVVELLMIAAQMLKDKCLFSHATS